MPMMSWLLLLILLTACETPMPKAPLVTSDTGAQCVDHCQGRYESCITNTASEGRGGIASRMNNREARDACRDNLGACYQTCR